MWVSSFFTLALTVGPFPGFCQGLFTKRHALSFLVIDPRVRPEVGRIALTWRITQLYTKSLHLHTIFSSGSPYSGFSLISVPGACIDKGICFFGRPVLLYYYSSLAFDLVESVYVLEVDNITIEDQTQQIMNDDRVRKAFLGG